MKINTFIIALHDQGREASPRPPLESKMNRRIKQWMLAVWISSVLAFTARDVMAACNAPDGTEVKLDYSINPNRDIFAIGESATMTLLVAGVPYATETLDTSGVSTTANDKHHTMTYAEGKEKSPGDCSINFNFTVVKVEISPPEMDAIEGVDSGTYTCNVAPALSSTFLWLSGSENGAWPATAGNSPALNYSASAANSTTIKQTRWFAKTPSRWLRTDGQTCNYKVQCDVVVAGVPFRASARLGVTVLLGALGANPAYTNWDSIIKTNQGGVWKVVGQGLFSRTYPTYVVSAPATSQFISQTIAHEEKHITQWKSGSPWMFLYDANKLYVDTLSKITAATEDELGEKINEAVLARKKNDDSGVDAFRCMGEEEARIVELAAPPDFLRLNDEEWKMLYVCP